MMCKIEPLNVSVGRVLVLIEGCSSHTFFLYHGDSLSSGPTDVCKLLRDCACPPDKIFAVSICCHIKT